MNKPFIAIIGISPIVAIFGFYFTGHTTVYSMYEAEERARQFVDEGRPASDCFKMHSFIPVYPPLGTMQGGCVRKYAEIKKDPAACELLMPSRYGLSCVGSATNNDICFVRNDNTVSGNGINVPIDECINGPDNIRANACCIIAINAGVKTENDCSSLKEDVLFLTIAYIQ